MRRRRCGSCVSGSSTTSDACGTGFIRDIGPQKNQIDVKCILADVEEVAVFHDFRSETPVIGPLPFAEWYSLKDGKIQSLTLYFDAREFAQLVKDQLPE